MSSKYTSLRVEIVPTATADDVAHMVYLVSRCEGVKDIIILPERVVMAIRVRVLNRTVQEVQRVLWAHKALVVGVSWL